MTLINPVNPAYSMGEFAGEGTTPQASRGNHIQFEQWKGN